MQEASRAAEVCSVLRAASQVRANGPNLALPARGSMYAPWFSDEPISARKARASRLVGKVFEHWRPDGSRQVARQFPAGVLWIDAIRRFLSDLPWRRS